MSEINITPQPGFVLVSPQPKEQESDGDIKRESGIILKGHTADRLKKQTTHLDWTVLATSSVSEFAVGDTLVTSKQPISVPLTVEESEFVVLTEAEVIAYYN